MSKISCEYCGSTPNNCPNCGAPESVQEQQPSYRIYHSLVSGRNLHNQVELAFATQGKTDNQLRTEVNTREYLYNEALSRFLEEQVRVPVGGWRKHLKTGDYVYEENDLLTKLKDFGFPDKFEYGQEILTPTEALCRLEDPLYIPKGDLRVTFHYVTTGLKQDPKVMMCVRQSSSYCY